MKILNIAFIVLFVLSAAVQYNDPDPLLWMAIYLFGALMCFFALRGNRFRGLLIAALVFCISYAVFLFVEKDGVLDWVRIHNGESIVADMQATRPWIEQTREFFGLLIVAASLAINLFAPLPVKKS